MSNTLGARDAGALEPAPALRSNPTSRLPKSIPAQICQPILYRHQYKEQVDGFMRELTVAKRLHEQFL